LQQKLKLLINEYNFPNESPIYWALKKNSLKLLNLVCRLGFHPDYSTSNYNHRTLLMDVIEYEEPSLRSYKHGVEWYFPYFTSYRIPNYIDYNKKLTKKDLIEILINNKADVNKKNYCGASILDIAISKLKEKNKQIEMFEEDTSESDDIEFPGRPMKDKKYDLNYPEIIQLLKKYGAKSYPNKCQHSN
jgi:hypothetical protein